MNKEQLKQSINEYLDSEDELAYQINAQWGTGKTYFIKNEVIGDKNRIKDYTPIYLSINGIENLENLKRKLNINLLFSISNNKNFKAVSMATANIVDSGLIPLIPYFGGRYSDLKKSFKESFNILKDPSDSITKYKNTVIFIDEFERCSIPIQELVGYLSDILNTYECKMIIISNEKEINEKDKFINIKEKLINKSGLLSVSPEEIYKEIILSSLKSRVSNEVLKYIEKFNKEVCNILNYINLRTFKSVVSSFIQILNKLKLDEKGLLDEGLKLSYTSIFVTTYAIKQGMDLSKINDQSIFSISFNKNKKNDSPENNFLSKLNFQNYFYSKYMEFPKQIKELVKNNLIDIKSYEDFIYNIFYKDTFRNLMIKLSRYRYFNDDSLCKLELESKNYYLNNELPLNKKIALYENLYCLYKKNMLFVKFDFNKLKFEIHSFILNPDNDIDQFSMGINNVYLENMLQESVNQRIFNDRKKSIYTYISNILTNRYNKYYDLPFCCEEGLTIKNIFNFLLRYKDINLVLMNNRSLVELDNFLREEVYKKNINVKNIDANKFYNFLSKLSGKNDDSIFKYNISVLQKTINSIVKQSNN
ncbi:hypothetical protein DY037_06875 [Apilactobacillus micheneri]|uniref:hypothetical protein n=1 Tax=Apilactobacillus micheneri TaxID=1899430 RepID=UPI001129CBFB|nr:hypothetical protein [Apilactobacillus micheneri]TPR48532.1 hypothetical protein DY037_06875 [Apilactobacillus micheneri]